MTPKTSPFNVEKPETIAAALTAQAQNHPGRLALAIARQGRRGNRYQEISVGELERDANVLASELAHHGIRRGMRTVLMIRPGREFCCAMFALLRLGAPPVLIDPGIGLNGVGHAIRQIMPDAFLGIRKAQIARRLFGWGRETLRIALTIESLSIRARREHEDLHQESPQEHVSDEVAAIAFTSGSTGPPKAVVFLHSNLAAQADLMQHLLGANAAGPHLATFPLFLIFAPVLGIPAILPDFDMSRPASASPAQLSAATEDHRCRTAFASPVVVRNLGSYCRETGRRLTSLEQVLSGGAPSNPDAVAALAAAIAPGGEVCTPYGSTEALVVSNIGSREILGELHLMTRQGAGVCVGRPVRGMTAKIIPISDAPMENWGAISPLPPGEIGEIAVSGDAVSRDYFNRPEATAQAKIPSAAAGAGANRFYHRMGDLGYLDAAGRLWMCGRKSHRVVTSRRVYFSVPVEGIFDGHPEVARTALVAAGAGDPVPALCVELAAPRRTAERARITGELRLMGSKYEQTREIQEVLFNDSFPVDARHNSKIRREELSAWATRKIHFRNHTAMEIT